MRAAIYRTTGAAREVLSVEEVDRPEPGPGHVRVKVHVSGVNPIDYKSRSGATARPVDGWQIPHHDGAGVIDAVGRGVPQSRIGQAVWLWFAAAGRFGTAAEWCVVPAEQAVPLPAGASMDLGACLGVPALTAHRCLFADGPLERRAVLVAGGAGAVGHYAVELARRAGARVAATVSSEEKGAMATAAGAHLVVNYRRDDALGSLQAFAAPMDRIVEVNLAANLDLDLALSGPETTVVSYAADGPDPTLPVRRCMTANVSLRFVLLYGVPRPALLQAVADVNAAVSEGALTVLPVTRFTLDQVAEAHEAVESGTIGKVLVDIV